MNTADRIHEFLHPEGHEWMKALDVSPGDVVRWFVYDARVDSVTVGQGRVVIGIVNPHNGAVREFVYGYDDELSVLAR